MRLDWFLPALRKTKDGVPAKQTWLGRMLRDRLPACFASDHQTKIRGRLRQWLRRLGPSWLYSPIRRIVQGLCLALFVWLFLYVCWPYTAVPDPMGKFSTDWQLVQWDQDSGEVVMRHDAPPSWIETADGMRILIDDNRSDPIEIGAFSISKRPSQNEFLLTPVENVAESSERIMMASGRWAISESRLHKWPSHYADDLARKELIPADTFLLIDPLVSISTAIAARQWVWSLGCAVGILIACVLIPRGFCGYLCPLGTLIDLFDWAVTRRTARFHVADDGWWVHAKYYLLLGSLICSVFGVLVTGYVAAIPVVTRGLLMTLEPIQSGILRGWHLVPTPTVGNVISLVLFVAVLGLGFLRPRFWCKYVCPSGAVFSLGNLIRVSERKVESSCIHCNKCIEVCPFDAIKADYTTRVTDCTLCQTCGGACPTHAIKFVERNNVVELKVENDPPTDESALGRRGFLSAVAGTSAAVIGAGFLSQVTRSTAAASSDSGWTPVRPPGSVPEPEFLQMCIRCGECFKACPNNVLQPMSLQQGLAGIWSPHVVADWAGCESSCNACGQVCPTGAIRALPLAEKRFARMGLAIVNDVTCLPLAGKEACQLCVDECTAAGYDAIEFTRVHTETDADGQPIEASGFLAPVVKDNLCVGCGLCQTRCHGINVEERGVLAGSAIIIEAGDGREDRFFEESYQAAAQQRLRDAPNSTSNEFYVPPAPNDGEQHTAPTTDDPFGLE